MSAMPWRPSDNIASAIRKCGDADKEKGKGTSHRRPLSLHVATMAGTDNTTSKGNGLNSPGSGKDRRKTHASSTRSMNFLKWSSHTAVQLDTDKLSLASDSEGIPASPISPALKGASKWRNSPILLRQTIGASPQSPSEKRSPYSPLLLSDNINDWSQKKREAVAVPKPGKADSSKQEEIVKKQEEESTLDLQNCNIFDDGVQSADKGVPSDNENIKEMEKEAFKKPDREKKKPFVITKERREAMQLNDMGLLAEDEEDDVEGAIELYRQAKARDPTFMPARINIGLGLESLGRVREAIEEYDGILEIDPEYKYAHFNIGRALELKFGASEQVVEKYKIAVELDSSFSDAITHLGLTLKKLGRYEEAMEYLEASLA